MKIHVISNLVMQPLSAAVEWAEISFSDYGDVFSSLMDVNSRANSSDINLVYCHLDADQLLGGKKYKSSCVDDWQMYFTLFEQWCSDNPAKQIIVSSLNTPPWGIMTHHELQGESSVTNNVNKFNKKLTQLSLQYPNLSILDQSRLYNIFGYEQLVNTNLWYMARVKYTKKMFLELAEYLKSIVMAINGMSKKVLVLDLDNTLWGGVLGEQGINGIQLSEDGIGKCYRDFQRAIKGLASVGVLLVINSKNNKDEVEAMFREHEMMLLKLEDFAAMRINWSNKAKNMLSISEELNLGLDSVVFIDDSPVERQLVSSLNSDIIVPEFPDRAEDLVRWMFESVIYPWFPRLELTTEDMSKTQQYRAQKKRKQVMKKIDYIGFLDSLDIRLKAFWNDANHIQRASQMCQKTNQFNLTTRRYTSPQISELLDDKNFVMLMISYKDKFLDEGLTGLALIDINEKRIDSFLLSCRVIGRRVENFMIAEIENYFSNLGITTINSLYIPTPKNKQVSEFYEQFEYQLDCVDKSGQKYYLKELL